MEIILIQDVDNLGAAHEKVSVKNGYARNFLIPQKKAIEASPSNLKQLDEKMKQQKKKEEKLLALKPVRVERFSVVLLPFSWPAPYAIRKDTKLTVAESIFFQK
jgi:ribosomal protein L9